MNANHYSALGLGLLFVTLSACGGTTSGGETDAASDSTIDTGGDGGACSPTCGTARTCCSDHCVNTANDPLNCGGCGVLCTGATPYCNGAGKCEATPCDPDAGTCGAGTTCCGSQCCGSTQICCNPQGPLDMGPRCATPEGTPPTCPQGCAPLCVSDRNLKQDVVAVDDDQILERVGNLPVSSWSYTFDPSVRHIGPMAQDFHDAFGLGKTDKAYDPIDAHGVTFGAIRALYAHMKDQEARIERLEEENAALRDSCR